MASSKTMQQAPIGSARWMHEESRLKEQYIEQEIEEFTYSVRNEIEWLNEHMSEAFSRGQFDVVEAFKTPGKLRGGKTPRTVRRVNPLNEEAQNPVTVFAQPPPVFRLPSPTTSKKVTAIEVAEDVNDEHIESPPPTRYSIGIGKENTDAYATAQRLSNRGITAQALTHFEYAKIIPPRTIGSSPIMAQMLGDRPRSEDEDEDVEMEMAIAPQASKTEELLNSEEALPFDQLLEENIPHDNESDKGIIEDDIVLDDEPEDADVDTLRQEDVQPSSPSEVSLPTTSVLRKKSSLNFASLPARDPITAKKSLGPRMSRLSQYDQMRPTGGVRESHVGPQQQVPADVVDDDDMDLDDLPQHTITEALEQSKTSTQRLHEQFAMLGKTGPSRLSKSIPSFVAQAQAQEKSASQQSAANQDENDDDWIGPISGQEHPQQERKSPLGFSEAASKFDIGVATIQRDTILQAAVIEHATIPSLTPGTATRHAPVLSPSSKLPVVSYPRLNAHAESTTPAGSPIRSRTHEGAISASKNKLFSVLKSAKGLFAGNATPQAVVESKQPVLSKQRPTVQRVLSEQEVQQSSKASSESETAAPQASRETMSSRRSSDRLRKLKSTVNEKDDSVIMLNSSTARPAVGIEPEEVDDEVTPADELEEPTSDMPPPQTTKSMLPTSQLQKPGELRRPLRAGMRPAPVSIKLASQRIGQPAAPVQDSIPIPSSSLRPPTLSKKASTSSIQTLSSTTSWKTASSTARPKALEAAARKREQEEREAQRRAEQKRELERKRAAKAEDDRRLAQELEQKKALEAKNAAQRQAAEQRRADAVRRNEQLRERTTKAEPLAKRPLTRTNTTEDVRTAAPAMNTAKAVKRPLANDADDESSRSTLKQEPKRRRTSQMADSNEGPSRPAMAPPIRPSNMHKGHTFATTTTTTAPSMFKATVTAQHNLQHQPKTPHYNDYAKYTNGKVPFGEVPNPPGTAAPNTTTQKIPLKNPGRPSPSQYPNGESIELPTIHTDSEDSDDDDDDGKSFVPPSWANSPVLRDLLRQQQLVDPLQVFGPIAPLVMEEVFKGNKERQAKFRTRTSSAVWTRDQLTAEEVRRDKEARERMDREGGWTFRPNA